MPEIDRPVTVIQKRLVSLDAALKIRISGAG